MPQYSFCQAFDGLHVGAHRLQDPGLEVLCRGLLRGLLPALPEVFFEVVGEAERFVPFERLSQQRVLIFQEVFLAAQQKVTRALDRLVSGQIQGAQDAAPHFINGFIGRLHDMEPVKHHRSLRQMLHGGRSIRRTHVAGDGFDLGSGGSQLGPKAFKAGLAAPLAHPQHLPAFQIDDQSDELGFVAQMLFVNGDAPLGTPSPPRVVPRWCCQPQV